MRLAESEFVRMHPYGEAGSIDYWIEAMKRAYVLGEERAQGEIDRLLTIRGPRPPMSFTDFPSWFGVLWTEDHPQAMPY